MTPNEFAILINGREYGFTLTKEEEKLAEENNLVVVYGASDDLMEFRGAINDELEAWAGTTARLNKDGILKAPCEEEREFCIHKCKYFKDVWSTTKQIKAIWGERKPAVPWSYKTDIPHETF